jgi:hypothetical protein
LCAWPFIFSAQLVESLDNMFVATGFLMHFVVIGVLMHLVQISRFYDVLEVGT